MSSAYFYGSVVYASECLEMLREHAASLATADDDDDDDDFNKPLLCCTPIQRSD